MRESVLVFIEERQIPDQVGNDKIKIMDMYREIILDHYKHPRNFGHLFHASATAQAYNATCGDKIIMEIAIADNKIKDVRFSGVGCAISQAAASMLTEKVKGMKISDVKKIKTNDIISML